MTQLKYPECEAMIDIETLDTTNSSVVFQVAIVYFEPDTLNEVNKEIWTLDVDAQLAMGRTVSASTIAFHLGIPANALKCLTSKRAQHPSIFLQGLSKSLEIAKPKAIWAKGSFDFNILEDMYGQCDVPVPWKYYQERELRTLMKECGVSKGDVSHNALEDCYAQIIQLSSCRLKIKQLSSCDSTGVSDK